MRVVDVEGSVETSKMMMKVVVMMMMMRVWVWVRVRVRVRVVGMMRDNPRKAPKLQKLNHHHWQEEGRNERMQETEVLAQQPTCLLEDRRSSPAG